MRRSLSLLRIVVPFLLLVRWGGFGEGLPVDFRWLVALLLGFVPLEAVVV